MKLQELSLDHRDIFLSMVKDYQENDPAGLVELGVEPEFDFDHFVKQCVRERMDWKPGPNKISKTRYLLLSEKNEAVGFAILQFPLDNISSRDGGNVRFVSPPSGRGAMNEAHTLNRMLFEAVRAGLARILVTCYADQDDAKKLAIEMNRGEYADRVSSPSDAKREVLRYWIRLR